MPAGGERLFGAADLDVAHLELLGTTPFKSGTIVHKPAPKARSTQYRLTSGALAGGFQAFRRFGLGTELIDSEGT